MCFSTLASFTATALLLPVGAYASKIAWEKEMRYLPLALIPVGFGIQQGFEGLVWLGLSHQWTGVVHVGSLGFLLFSHGIWPVWIAIACLCIEQRPHHKAMLRALAAVGLAFGLSLYAPFVLSPGSFSTVATQGSLNYQTHIIYDRFFPRDISRLIYMLITLSPLGLSNTRQLKLLGGLWAIALIIAYLAYRYAFASVWCFFAAVLSLYIGYILHQRPSFSET